MAIQIQSNARCQSYLVCPVVKGALEFAIDTFNPSGAIGDFEIGYVLTVWRDLLSEPLSSDALKTQTSSQPALLQSAGVMLISLLTKAECGHLLHSEKVRCKRCRMEWERQSSR